MKIIQQILVQSNPTTHVKKVDVSVQKCQSIVSWQANRRKSFWSPAYSYPKKKIKMYKGTIVKGIDLQNICY